MRVLGLPIAASILLMLAGFVSPLAGQQIGSSVVASKHNLSASGPGTIRATSEQQICIFCHTPHNATPVQPLWNRELPMSAYTVYSSSSLQASPGQPTGSSKLCLSCHDGTIAVGSVASRDMPITMSGGITVLLPDTPGYLGTDLSDDHPISFKYDADLLTKNPNLKSPSSLPGAIRLDAGGHLQCSSCHDAHNDQYGKFLVMDNSNSQLCNSCHIGQPGDVVGHANCAGCHQSHTAPSGAYLLRGTTETATCLLCHGDPSGTPLASAVPMSGCILRGIATDAPTITASLLAAATPSWTDKTEHAMLAKRALKLGPDMRKLSVHDARSVTAQVRVARTPGTKREKAAGQTTEGSSCVSCHSAHTMSHATAAAPYVSGKLGRISGVNAAGADVPKARYQYEVCFKCHADKSTDQPTISRRITQANLRLKFSPTAVSFHPVEVAGKNTDVPSLVPTLSVASLIYCTDCHGSDTSKSAGGAGANGPHGSDIAPLLIAGYSTLDNTSESAAAYALCYRCHDRNNILADQSFNKHKLHIVDKNTPCSVCHDPHGISSAQGSTLHNSHLINFDRSIVQPDPVTGRLEYQTLGSRSGQCYLACHGVDHSPKAYPQNVGAMQLRVAPLRNPAAITPKRK